MGKRYKAQSIRYLANAFRALEAGEAEKASEFLWGSLAQALKAVAALKGIKLRTHKAIRNYARELAKERGDRDISDTYDRASYLHSNFYEAELGVEEVYIYAEDIRVTVDKLLRLIPPKK